MLKERRYGRLINAVAVVLALAAGLIIGYFVALIGVAVGAAAERAKEANK